jgi:hypothetical protein
MDAARSKGFSGASVPGQGGAGRHCLHAAVVSALFTLGGCANGESGRAGGPTTDIPVEETTMGSRRDTRVASARSEGGSGKTECPLRGRLLPSALRN